MSGQYDFIFWQYDIIFEQYYLIFEQYYFIFRQYDFIFRQYDFIFEQYDFIFEQYDFMFGQYDFIFEQYYLMFEQYYLIFNHKTAHLLACSTRQQMCWSPARTADSCKTFGIRHLGNGSAESEATSRGGRVPWQAHERNADTQAKVSTTRPLKHGRGTSSGVSIYIAKQMPR